MNIVYLIAVLVALCCPKQGLQKIATFNLYMDRDSYSGEIILDYSSSVDKSIYPNDCAALMDLFTLRFKVCSDEEMQQIRDILQRHQHQINKG